MHYLDYLAKKLASRVEERRNDAASAGAAAAQAMREILASEVEGGRLHYNVMYSEIGDASSLRRASGSPFTKEPLQKVAPLD